MLILHGVVLVAAASGRGAAHYICTCDFIYTSTSMIIYVYDYRHLYLPSMLNCGRRRVRAGM